MVTATDNAGHTDTAPIGIIAKPLYNTVRL